MTVFTFIYQRNKYVKVTYVPLYHDSSLITTTKDGYQGSAHTGRE